MAVFVHTKGGLMYEAAIGGQKFSFKPKHLVGSQPAMRLRKEFWIDTSSGTIFK